MKNAMSKNFKKVAVSFLAGAALVGSGAASAALVTVWNYQADAGFVNWADTNGTFGNANNNPGGSAVLGSAYNTNLTSVPPPANLVTPGGLPTVLSWGTSTGAGQSSIGVGPSVSGSVTTNAAFVVTTNFFHDNNPITGPTLRSASIFDTLKLTPNTPAGPSQPPLQLGFGVNFTETPNSTPCVVTTSPTPCNDIFVLTVVGAVFDGTTFNINQDFIYAGYDYTVSLKLGGVGALTAAECTAAGVAAGCVGVTTREDALNQLPVSLKIAAREITVPEPGTLALLGLGLLGLGAARRRKM